MVQAEIAVAAGVVLPWYLWELRKAGIHGGVLARRLRIPGAGAMAAGLACWGAGQLIKNELAALALSAAAGAVIILLLIQRLWPELAAAGQSSALAAGEAGADGLAAPVPGRVSAEVPALAPAGQAAGGEAAVPLVPGPALAAEPAPGPPEQAGPAPCPPAPGPLDRAWSPAEPESLAEWFFRRWDAMNEPHPNGNGSGVTVPPPPQYSASLPPQFRATAAALGWEHPPLDWPDPEDGQEP